MYPHTRISTVCTIIQLQGHLSPNVHTRLHVSGLSPRRDLHTTLTKLKSRRKYISRALGYTDNLVHVKFLKY